MVKPDMPTQFIAEVSSNHAQNLDRCLEFIDVASEVGCDAVKFQLFRVEELFSAEVLKARPQVMERKQWELPQEFLPILYAHSKQRGIQFSVTPFSLGAVEELYPYVDFYKIASYELLWDDLLATCAATCKPVVLSTGMATLDEIQHAVDILKKSGCKDLTLLHCTSAYPTPVNECNLAAIQTLREITGCKTGWSDHSASASVIHRAVHRWQASAIEFHLDLEGQGAEFKSGHCWLPDLIGTVISDVRLGHEGDGNGVKAPVPSEIEDRDWRADPSDGLRPLLSMRKRLKNELI